MWRVFFVFGLSIIILAFVWISLYFWGLSKPISIYQPVFIPASKIFITLSGSQNEPQFPHDFDEGYLLPVTTKDDMLFCGSWHCDQVVERFRDKPVILQVDLNQRDIDLRLMHVLDSWKDLRSKAVISRYPNVLSSIKKLAPAWSYGASMVEQIRFKFAESLRLEVVPDFLPDFWPVNLQNTKEREMVTESLLAELKRRQKPLICLGISNREYWDLAQGLGCHAFVVEEDFYLRLKSKL